MINIPVEKEITRILFFIDGLRRGGKERRFIELINALPAGEIDYRIALIHSNIEYDIPEKFRDKIVFLPKKNKGFSLFILFFHLCQSFKPDIVHTWSSIVTFYSLPAIIILKIKLVNSQITDAAPWDSRNILFRLISRINIFFSEIVIANSYAGLKAYKINDEKGRVIYNGVSMGRFNVLESRNSIKTKYGLSYEFCVVMVASFSRNKDYNLFVDIAAEIAKTRNDIMFVAVGSGEFELDVRKRVEKLGLLNIKFLGSCSNVEVILKGCDVGVLFSPNGEGISNSIIEYLAMGLPSIVNDLGGNKEIINDGYNGFLTNLSEKDIIISKILLVLDNKIIYRKMSYNAKQTVIERFDVKRMSDEFLQIYKEV